MNALVTYYIVLRITDISEVQDLTRDEVRDALVNHFQRHTPLVGVEVEVLP